MRRPLVFEARIRRGIPARSAWPGTRVPRRQGKVGTLHACRAGVPRVQRGLTCNGTRTVATRSAQRTCTLEVGRSEVFRTVPPPVCSSGHARNVAWGAPGNNTRIRAAAHNSSGRRTPPLRAVSRAASPFPPMDSISGGAQGWGARVGRGGGGVRGCCRSEPQGTFRVSRCGWRC